MAGKKGREHHKESKFRFIVRIVNEYSDLDCWLWETSIDKDGYGHVKHPVKGYMDCVHIVAWEAKYGAVPEGLQLDHDCRVRNCWNPEHLIAVTQAENKARAVHVRGEVCRNGHIIAEVGRGSWGYCGKCGKGYTK